tara:strand:+ start:481 stop:783 length:303 start_codon:yes stop_codon:yes gene_type:complete
MNNKLKAIILDAIKEEDEYNSSWTDQESFSYAWDRFINEYGWNIQRVGLVLAAQDWFQGLAMHVPFWDDDIEKQGFNPDSYWYQLATTFCQLHQQNFHLP